MMETESGCSAANTDIPPLRSGRAYYYPEVKDEDWNDWRWQFRNRVTTLEELSKHLQVPAEEWEIRRGILRDFRMGITPYYLSLVDAGDPQDPLLKQVVPVKEEHEFRDLGEEDPLGEEQFSPVPGITHRYPDRVLMVISNSCAIYCRYCTRKRIMYEDAVPEVEIDRMVDYIARTPSVRDVVVSGGDPLNNSTSKLEKILAKLRAIPHLEMIRIGSRVPVALPQRITDELCEMLQKYHPLWINVHYNHPNELTPEAAKACDKLLRAGIPLNNQSVLLRGVNDDVTTMKALIHGLLRMRVRPYYLYQCDPVRGTEHFRTTVSKGIEIMEGLRGHTSGLGIPTYVIDAPGGGGKIPVTPQYLLSYDPSEGRAIVRNFQGKVYEYLEPRHLVAAANEAKSTQVGATRAAKKSRKASAPSRTTKPSTPRAPKPAALAGSNGTRKKSGPIVGKSGWVHRGVHHEHGGSAAEAPPASNPAP